MSHYRAKLIKRKFVATLQNLNDLNDLNAVHFNLALFRKVKLTTRQRAAHSPQGVSLATESREWKKSVERLSQNIT